MIKIEVNDEAVIRKLNELAAKSRDLQPIMRYAAGEMAKSVETAFDKERDPATGALWPALAGSTKKARKAKGYTGKMLQRTGHLVRSIQQRWTGESADVSTNVEYAAVHQFGFDGTQQVGAHTRMINHVFGRKLKNPLTVSVKAFSRSMDIPARPFLGLDDYHQGKIIDRLNDHLAGS